MIGERHMQSRAILLAATAFAAIAMPLAAEADAPGRSVEVRAARLPLVRTIDERFQSFQIGMSHLTGGETWKSYDSPGLGGPPSSVSAVRETRQAADLANRRLRTLAAALGPFNLRYGGTTTNSVWFQDNDEARPAKPPAGFSVVLTRPGWKGGLDFAKAVGGRILTGFTVSSGVRDAAGAWTPREAAPWLAYTRAAGGEIYAAELFNEPNAPDPAGFKSGVDAARFARDFASFSAFMKRAAPRLKLVGPGVATLGVSVPALEGTTPEQYMSALPKPRFDIVSYHFYGAVAERCAPPNSPMGLSPEMALSEAWLARADEQFQRHKALRDHYAPGAPIWLTETGAAACGGPRWQPSYLDTFRYLDTQGRLAKQGLGAIFHHALISGSNGIIDEKTFLPNADYWAALLWRRLMGTRVLDAGSVRPGLHLYAHCQRGTADGVTILAINLETAPAVVRVQGPADVYALTASTLQSRTVLLNGRALALDRNDRLPVLGPVRAVGSITLAPTSIAFITVPRAGNPACRIR
jgi:heparanase